VILRLKSPHRIYRFWGTNRETLHHLGFETQPRNSPPIFRPNREKLSALVLRSNRRKPSQWFWGKITNKPSQWFWGQTTDKPLTLVLRLNHEIRALRLLVHDADRTRCYQTSRSSGYRVPNLCDHSRSSTPGLLLLPRSSSLPAIPHPPPAHHETSKCNSPHDTRIMVKLPKCLRFKFKTHQINDSSQSNQRTDHLVSRRVWSSAARASQLWGSKIAS
jgi:hypothetical protein